MRRPLALLHSANPGPRRRLRLPLLVLLAWLVGGFALPAPSRACTVPDNSVNIWIIIVGDNVWIKVRGLMAEATTLIPGTLQCGCGLNIGSLARLDSVTVLDDATQQVFPGFNFIPNKMTGDALGPDFTGFAAKLTRDIPANPAVDLSFHGVIAPGTTFADLKGQLAGQSFTSGQTNSSGVITKVRFPAVLSIDQTQSSSIAPRASVVQMSAEPPGSVVVNLVDPISGLQTVSVAGTSNASASVAPFAAGTTAPVSVAISASDEKELASARLTACNQVGNCTVSRAVLMPMSMGPGNLTVESMSGFDPSRSSVLFQNGDPGIRMLSLLANGQRFSIRPLAGGQRLELDLSLASQKSTRLTCAARGEPGARGLLVLLTGE